MSRLNLTIDERSILQEKKVSLKSLAFFSPHALAQITRFSSKRCIELIALSQFQTLTSVGPSLAQDLYDLGFHDLKSLKRASPKQMFQDLEKLRGQSIDPCVEDVFRCAVEQVKNPELPKALKQWWYWTDKRGKE
jgi:uroporphyrinogen-III synthase